MRLYRKNESAFLRLEDDTWLRAENISWEELINRRDLFSYLTSMKNDLQAVEAPNTQWDAPITTQEVWAAGVTYLRSKVARMEEAEAAGGGDFYDKVYEAERPEIFFKATAARTVGSGEEVYIRRDSTWDVPEPELTLFCSSHGTIEGYTIGNDMSSRSIEGENPLYLPQAKTYEKCASLGPCIFVPRDPISLDTTIRLCISRNGQDLYKDAVQISQMKRRFPDLVEFLFRECNFPAGVFLMTGTCLVPDDSFTLHVGDHIVIEIDHIGQLSNHVGRRAGS